MKSGGGIHSYYAVFDNFSFKIGLSIVTSHVSDEKTGDSMGFIPYIRYLPNNLLEEEPRDQNLIGHSSPLNLSDCYSLLAKELLYVIMRIKDLENVIAKPK